MRLLASCCAAVILMCLSAVAHACSEGSLPSLRFIGEQQLAHQLQYKDSTVGGLSGIDYDVDTDTWILVSDERSRHNAARFYTATRQGEFISELDLHPMFSMHTDRELGPRDNLSFEGLRFSQNKQSE